MADRIIFILTVILAAVYLYATEQFPRSKSAIRWAPRHFRGSSGIGLLMTAAGLLAGILRAPKTGAAGGERKGSGGHRRYLVVVAAVVWTGLYFAVFIRLGYAIATAVYLLALTACFNRGKWIANVLDLGSVPLHQLSDVHQAARRHACRGASCRSERREPWKL